MRAAINAVLREQMPAAGQHGEERRRYRRHPTARDQRRLRVFERRELGMQHRVIGRVVKPYVAQVVVAGLPRVLVGRGLKYRHRDRAADERLRLAGVNQLGIESFDKSRHGASDSPNPTAIPCPQKGRKPQGRKQGGARASVPADDARFLSRHLRVTPFSSGGGRPACRREESAGCSMLTPHRPLC